MPVSRSLDLRYQGQSFSLNLPWMPLSELQQAFHDLHQRTYGHALDLPVELVNLRLRLEGEAPPFELPRIDGPEPDNNYPAADPARDEPARVEPIWAECAGFEHSLPLYQVDSYGNLLLQRT